MSAALWRPVVFGVLFPVLVAAGVEGVRSGLHGLRGGRLRVPQRRGPPVVAAGVSARVHGALFLALGAGAVLAGLWGLGALAYDLAARW